MWLQVQRNVEKKIQKIKKDSCKFSLTISDGTVEDYEEFLAKYTLLLHPSHYHMLTAKHSLMQMLGRTEGHLIQDMPEEQVSYLDHFVV